MTEARRAMITLLVCVVSVCLCEGMTEQEALNALAGHISKSRGANCQAPTIPTGDETVHGTDCGGDFIVQTINGRIVSLFDFFAKNELSS